MADFFEGRYKNRNAGVVRKIKNIINERYIENLSVAMLAEEVYLTPNYISLIFKRETGETIVEYLTRVRMEAAKELLETSELKVFEIAGMVGYEDPKKAEKYLEFNKSAIVMETLGFSFNNSPVKSEIAAIKNVSAEYGNAVMILNPDDNIPKAISKFEAAGIRKVQEEVQAQLDDYLARTK